MPLAFLAALPGAHASSTFAEKCPDLASCTQAVAQLLDQKYLYDQDLKVHTATTPNFDMTRENAEIVFTAMLAEEGYSRVPVSMGEKADHAATASTFQIMRMREARDAAIPSIASDRDHAPALPPTWDMMTLKYKAAHPEVLEHTARLLRSFMPASARIIASDLSGQLLITDVAPNLKKCYDLARENDVEPSVTMKRQWAEDDRKRAQTAQFRVRRRAERALSPDERPAAPTGPMLSSPGDLHAPEGP